MNDYSFETVEIGTSESFSVRVTETMLDRFREITGDENPLHVDAAFAQQAGFPGRVAYGLLTGSFFSTLAGVYLPGKRSVIHQVEVNFGRPVFPGDELLVKGTCVEKDERFRTMTLKTVVTRAGSRVAWGRMVVGFLKVGA